MFVFIMVIHSLVLFLKELGFKRPGDQNKDDFAERNVSKERISAMDGDVLFYFTFDKGNEKKDLN